MDTRDFTEEDIVPAGFWIRLWATLLDSIIIFLPINIVLFFLFQIDFAEDISRLLSSLYYLLLPLFWSGQTVGKAICRIRIVKTNGEDVHIGNMLLRVIVSGIIYGITFGIAAIVSVVMVCVREDKRALHDLIAGTCVTYTD
ncbi:RDD family protein [Bacillus horti]|uniref:RDD family membrane protein YckC n=1 Tax=Caldalkalibacillus horti TaxID=77523 RepID=A0ABT9VWF8_9BACI|nr:RDD family protein [Bacillus horti]MDQ0165230.1 putative RDD family membrane protein YckC [Bacillus horti]